MFHIIDYLSRFDLKIYFTYEAIVSLISGLYHAKILRITFARSHD